MKLNKKRWKGFTKKISGIGSNIGRKLDQYEKEKPQREAAKIKSLRQQIRIKRLEKQLRGLNDAQNPFKF